MKRFEKGLFVLLAVVLSLAAGGCATTGEDSRRIDWTDLADKAAPSFEAGECGPALVWRKEVAVYEEVVVEGVLTVRRKCEAKPPSNPASNKDN